MQKVDLFIKTSNDSGGEFSSEFGLNLSPNIGASINPQISVSANNVNVVWQDNSTQLALPSTTYDILFKRSDNNGQRFHNTIDISEGPRPSINPQISASDNNVYVVWQDITSQGEQEIFFSRVSISE